MKLAVVGSLNMDMAVTTPRIPGRGETVLGDALHISPGGKGANQAFALARLGAGVTLFGCAGDDDFGRRLTDNLAQSGVGIGHIHHLPGVQTGVAMITVDASDNTIVVIPGANARVDRDYIDQVRPWLLQSDLVMMQLEIPLDTVVYVSDLCHAAAIPILLNPAPAARLPAGLLDQVRWITPNEHEARLVYGYEGPLEDLLVRYPGKLIVTLGASGSVMADGNGQIIRTPAVPAHVIDTTGAGDTFNAALAYAICHGFENRQALSFANAAAGISTEHLGAQAGMPSYRQVMDRMASAAAADPVE